MDSLWHKIFNSFTRGVDLRLVLMQSSLLALISCLFTFPYFYYLIFDAGRLIEYRYSNPWLLLFSQLLLLLLICLLSCMVGFSLSKRFNLPGFFNKESFVHSIPLLLGLGIAMAFLSYLFFDRYFIEISPASYPKELVYLVSFPLKNSFTDEIILRFCFLTICIGLLKNRTAAIFILSFIAALFTIKYFNFMGIALNRIFLSQFLLSFGGNIILGYIFVTRGLISSMFLKLIFSVKYFFVVINML